MSDEQSIISHLLELRNRLLRIVAALVVCFIALFTYPGANKLYTWLAQPMLESLPKGGQMIATAVTTPFFVPMKVAAMTAFLITLPYTLYQVWGFIAPGMYAHEKRFALPLAITSTLLFFAGMAFAYFAVFKVVFGFITQVAPEGVAVMTDIGSYLDFVLTLFLAFGIAFEVPVAVVLLVKMKFVTVAKLKEIRPYVIVGAFILGAIFTPPDFVTQFMLAIPIWLLYELGIVVAGFISKPGPPEEAYQPLSDAEMDAELDKTDIPPPVEPEPK